jgi:LDH2 family malate/lactate/ureidoglycolate dehydrogenase
MATHETDTVTVAEPELHAHCEALLVRLGVPADRAALVADTLVDADLRGVHSHGAHLMALYASRLRSGHIRADAPLRVVRDDGSTVVLDAGLGLGQVAGIHAIDLAVERARSHGLAAVSVRECTHLGALGYYTRRAATSGCVGLVVQNGPAFVPPYGGLTGLFSTNPISYAFPTVEEPLVVYDVATTAVAGNKLLLARKRGDATIPAGWASDERGRPTTDPAVASLDHLQWFGGHKGYGIAFLVEVLGGVLADSCFGRTERTESPLHGKERIAKGAFFLAVDVARFMPGDELGRRVDTLIRDVRSSEPAEGHERVYVPGEIEHVTCERRRREGIPLPRALVDELGAFAGELGVAPLGTGKVGRTR